MRKIMRDEVLRNLGNSDKELGEKQRALVRGFVGMTEPLMKLKDDSLLSVPVEITLQCVRNYSDKSWYGAKIKNGWPGVKGDVLLGFPVVDRFGEIIVVYQNENGYIKSTSLGKHQGK